MNLPPIEVKNNQLINQKLNIKEQIKEELNNISAEKLKAENEILMEKFKHKSLIYTFIFSRIYEACKYYEIN